MSASNNPTEQGAIVTNQAAKKERFEIRLRANIAAEADLLAELEARDGVYGGKTELLRECLRRGFVALRTAVDKQPADATEESILDALASTFPTGEYSYRIGKLYLDAREAVTHGTPMEPSASDVTRDNRDDQTRSPESAFPASELAEASSPAGPVPQPEAPVSADSPGPVQASEPSDNPKPRPPAVDWGRLRGIAGREDDGTENR
ncbi:hypothetical protein BOFL111202_17615 [Bordetella flabilis]